MLLVGDQQIQSVKKKKKMDSEDLLNRIRVLCLFKYPQTTHRKWLSEDHKDTSRPKSVDPLMQ